MRRWSKDEGSNKRSKYERDFGRKKREVIDPMMEIRLNIRNEFVLGLKCFEREN